MSSMLEQAIVDAEALKEAAIRNAESTLIEKYSIDIKNAVNHLLEQGPPPEGGEEEMMAAMLGGLGGGDPMADPAAAAGPTETPEFMGDIPPAHGDGEKLCPCPEEDQPITIDLDQLGAALQSAEAEGDMGMPMDAAGTAAEIMGEEGPPEEQYLVQESLLIDILGEGYDMSEVNEDTQQEVLENEDALEEEYDLNELLDLEEDENLEEADESFVNTQDTTSASAVETDIRTETGADVGTMEEQLQAYHHHYNELYEQHARLFESHAQYEQEYKNLYGHWTNGQEALQKLQEENEKYKGLFVEMKEKLNEANLQNAKLLYTNRVLDSISLNERQKDKIVEAVQKAGSVEEAKTIFETLQSAVVGTNSNKREPKSLNEAVQKRSSAFLPRKEAKSDPRLVDRMQKLAGIKNNDA